MPIQEYKWVWSKRDSKLFLETYKTFPYLQVACDPDQETKRITGNQRPYPRAFALVPASQNTLPPPICMAFLLSPQAFPRCHSP